MISDDEAQLRQKPLPEYDPVGTFLLLTAKLSTAKIIIPSQSLSLQPVLSNKAYQNCLITKVGELSSAFCIKYEFS